MGPEVFLRLGEDAGDESEKSSSNLGKRENIFY